MMRLLVLGLAITGFCLWVTCSCAGGDDAMSADDGGVDSDSDSDTDTGGVPIEYPEALNPFLNPNSLMTGPISPPPEQVLGGVGAGDGPPGPDPTLDDDELDDAEMDDEELDEDGEQDAGEPDEEI